VRLLLVLSLLALSACTGLLAGGGPAPDLYTLSPATRFPDGLQRANWHLLIEEPTAVGGLEANRVAVQRTPNEVRYFAGIRWVERASRMVQGLLVESFERADAVTSVERYTVGPRVDYVLKSELRDFQAEQFESVGTPTVHVRLSVRLVRGARQDAVWTRDFTARVPAKTRSPQEVISAFDQALGLVMTEIVTATVRDTPPPR
jgi:cholesterol transport system auxiliary component